MPFRSMPYYLYVVVVIVRSSLDHPKRGIKRKKMKDGEGKERTKKNASCHLMQGYVKPILCYRRLCRVEDFSLFRFPGGDCP